MPDLYIVANVAVCELQRNTIIMFISNLPETDHDRTDQNSENLRTLCMLWSAPPPDPRWSEVERLSRSVSYELIGAFHDVALWLSHYEPGRAGLIFAWL